MTRRLNQLITPEIGTRDITPDNRMHAERLISRVSLFVHPEARRVLNRCARSADDIIRGRTQGAFAAAARRSPAEQTYTTAVTAFYAGQFAEALQAVDQAITLDELRASLYSLRGEILLRMNRTEEAAESLLHADFLNPESPAIWLQVALMKVAQEKPEQGMMLAESALALNDPDPQHFIAAAAVFAKAADKCKEDESARRAEYIDKSFALIQKAIELGFSNLSRLEHDPAFTSIMPDERWKPLSSR